MLLMLSMCAGRMNRLLSCEVDWCLGGQLLHTGVCTRQPLVPLTVVRGIREGVPKRCSVAHILPQLAWALAQLVTLDKDRKVLSVQFLSLCFSSQQCFGLGTGALQYTCDQGAAEA